MIFVKYGIQISSILSCYPSPHPHTLWCCVPLHRSCSCTSHSICLITLHHRNSLRLLGLRGSQILQALSYIAPSWPLLLLLPSLCVVPTRAGTWSQDTITSLSTHSSYSVSNLNPKLLSSNFLFCSSSIYSWHPHGLPNCFVGLWPHVSSIFPHSFMLFLSPYLTTFNFSALVHMSC